MTNRSYRSKIDKAVTDVVGRFKESNKFVNALNIELLLGLSDPKHVRKDFLRDLFRAISEIAISTFDFQLYYTYVMKRCYDRNTGVLIRDFYNQTLAHDKDLASRLLRQLSTQALHADKYTARRVVAPLMKELLPSVDTGSLEVQACFQSLVGAYITKLVGEEPSKPQDWARPAEVHTCHSGCKPCSELNHFLKDPGAKEITMALNADDQIHVRWNFCYLEVGTGDREGEVRYTKTLKGWESRHRTWVSDGKEAQKTLQELPKDALKQALGDKYDALMALDPGRTWKGAQRGREKIEGGEM